MNALPGAAGMGAWPSTTCRCTLTSSNDVFAPFCTNSSIGVTASSSHFGLKASSRMARRTVLQLNNPSRDITNASEVLGSTPAKMPVDQSDSIFLLLASCCFSLKFNVSPIITTGCLTRCPVMLSYAVLPDSRTLNFNSTSPAHSTSHPMMGCATDNFVPTFSS